MGTQAKFTVRVTLRERNDRGKLLRVNDINIGGYDDLSQANGVWTALAGDPMGWPGAMSLMKRIVEAADADIFTDAPECKTAVARLRDAVRAAGEMVDLVSGCYDKPGVA